MILGTTRRPDPDDYRQALRMLDEGLPQEHVSRQLGLCAYSLSDLAKPRPHARREYVPFPRSSATYGPPRPTTGALIRRALASIAKKHGLTPGDLSGPNRTNRYVAARHEAMFVLHHRFGLSLPRVGFLLGGRDHTTVLHGIRRHRQRVEAQA